jgi:hypothetical protein
MIRGRSFAESDSPEYGTHDEGFPEWQEGVTTRWNEPFVRESALAFVIFAVARFSNISSLVAVAADSKHHSGIDELVRSH